MNRGTILIYDGFVSARYLSGSLQGDGSVEAYPLSSVTYTVKAYDNPTLTLHGRPSDDQFGEVRGYAANPGSHATMVFDTANNIGRFYGVLERPKFKICENQQQITPQAIRLSPEVQSELAQIARNREVAKMTVNQGLERFFDLSVTGNRVRLYVGDADTASVALRAMMNDTASLVFDFFSSPDGYVIASGKSAVATLTGGSSVLEIMSSDFSIKGYPWLIGVVSTAAGSANTLADVWVTAKRNTA